MLQVGIHNGDDLPGGVADAVDDSRSQSPFVPADDYGYVAEQPLSLPVPTMPTSEWGRVSLVYDTAEQIESVFKATVAPWSAYVQAAGGGDS